MGLRKIYETKAIELVSFNIQVVYYNTIYAFSSGELNKQEKVRVKKQHNTYLQYILGFKNITAVNIFQHLLFSYILTLLVNSYMYIKHTNLFLY